MWFRPHGGPERGDNGAHSIDEETEVQRGARTRQSPRGTARSLNPGLAAPNLFPYALLPPSPLAVESEGAAHCRGHCRTSGPGFC